MKLNIAISSGKGGTGKTFISTNIARVLEIIGEIPDKREIAECYSIGDLVCEYIPEYNALFINIAEKMMRRAWEDRKVIKKPLKLELKDIDAQKIVCNTSQNQNRNVNGKELVVISGKGGTGKTSLVASFCALEKNIVISDCDVDAADLHLVLSLNDILKYLNGLPNEKKDCVCLAKMTLAKALKKYTHQNIITN
jgi:Mrp family chromosome partitioning ATPase